MKVIYTIIALGSSSAALAHTGDHSAVGSAIAHSFASSDHLAPAMIFAAGFAALTAIAFRIGSTLKARRAARRAK